MIVDTMAEIIALITSLTGRVFGLLQYGNALLANVRAGKVTDDELRQWKEKVTKASRLIEEAQRALFSRRE